MANIEIKHASDGMYGCVLYTYSRYDLKKRRMGEKLWLGGW